MTDLAASVISFCSRACLRGQCGFTLWGTLEARPSPTWPAQAFRRRSYVTLVLAQALLRPAISGALLRLGPNVKRRRWPD